MFLRRKAGIWMRLGNGCSKRFTFSLHRRDCGVPGVFTRNREAGKRFVVMDTAPTGHTLFCLMLPGLITVRLPGRWGIKAFYHSDDAASGPGTYQSFAGTLPETTPVLEAANLQSDLERRGFIPGAGLSITAFRLHRRIAAALPARPTRASSNRGCEKQHASRIALVPVMAAEPTGIENSESWLFNFFCIYRAAKPSFWRIYVTGRRYFCPDHRFGYWQPKGLGIGWSATLGAVLALSLA